MKRHIQRLLGGIEALEIAVLVFSFAAMTAFLLADVIGRELFRQGVFGATYYALYFLILSSMLSFDVAIARDAHLRPTAFDGLVPDSWDPVMRRIGHLLSAGIAALVIWGTWTFIAESRFFNERNLTIRLPLWPMQLPLLLGFGMSFLRHLAYAAFPDIAPRKPVTEAKP